MVGLITHCPEEPYANSARTVLWELGAGNCPWLPYASENLPSKLRTCRTQQVR